LTGLTTGCAEVTVQTRQMALHVAALILVFSILSSAATANDPPKCTIPEGHKEGEIVGRYDPEPNSG